ncbi:hypothetical protein [Dyadobacter psychrotolerans]|uniref:DNA-binding protein n=1 Tax=Dyadobacter psychrotolerans TaxID=2541721 RepID=A0A4R5DVK0_9BACT|nr:hypothetical protein [Dyadobacter psychrotolerans]TDE16574.1 hypothetical protein E0F88_10080 [Dyadobacter psychrotolerans]
METKTKQIELEELLNESRALLTEAGAYLSKDGEKYKLNDWITIKEYCKRFDIKSTQVVTNWIKRGIIPKENIILIEEYNNIRLIKAVAYQ